MNFFEQSFHFFLKRSASFNLLSSNTISTLPKQDSARKDNNSFSDLNNLVRVASSYQISMFADRLTTANRTINSKGVSSNFSKDLLLVQKHRYLLNKKRIDIAYNLTKYSPKPTSSLKLFNQFINKQMFYRTPKLMNPNFSKNTLTSFSKNKL